METLIPSVTRKTLRAVSRLLRSTGQASLLLFSGAGLRFHSLPFRTNIVFRMRHSHQISVEPSDNVLQPLDAVPWFAGAREFVGLARENDHRRRTLQIFQCAE